MEVDVYYKIQCDECGKANWLYGGHSDDMTFFGSDFMKCWHCGKVHSLNDDVEYEEDFCDTYDTGEKCPCEQSNKD